MIVIGIAGRAGAGKDTAAAALVRDLGFVRVGFADALKAEVRTRLRRTLLAIARTQWWIEEGRSEDEQLDDLLTVKPEPIRALLQEYGTDVRRAENPAYWLAAWCDRVAHRVAHRPRVVVPDVRFENEMRLVKDLGGWLIHVSRPGLPLRSVAGHVSEVIPVPPNGWDADFLNDASPEALQAAVVAWVRTVCREGVSHGRDS